MTTVHFSTDVQPTFDGRCGGLECHGFWRNRWIMEWVNVAAPGCSDGRKYVAPGDPDHSYLVDKLLGRNLCSGQRMPRLGNPLSADDMNKIVSWICAGAQND